MKYEIVNIHNRKNEIWAHLICKNYEYNQQLVLIKPLKEIMVYLDENCINIKESVV